MSAGIPAPRRILRPVAIALLVLTIIPVLVVYYTLRLPGHALIATGQRLVGAAGWWRAHWHRLFHSINI